MNALSILLLSYLAIGATLSGLALAATRMSRKIGQPDHAAEEVIRRRGTRFVLVALTLLWPAALVQMWMDRR